MERGFDCFIVLFIIGYGGASRAPSGFHGLVCAVTVWDGGPDSAGPAESGFDEVV